MTQAEQQVYLQGVKDKCVSIGVDAEQLLKEAGIPMPLLKLMNKLPTSALRGMGKAQRFGKTLKGVPGALKAEYKALPSAQGFGNTVKDFGRGALSAPRDMVNNLSGLEAGMNPILSKAQAMGNIAGNAAMVGIPAAMMLGGGKSEDALGDMPGSIPGSDLGQVKTQSFAAGFMSKCAERGMDSEELLKDAQYSTSSMASPRTTFPTGGFSIPGLELPTNGKPTLGSAPSPGMPQPTRPARGFGAKAKQPQGKSGWNFWKSLLGFGGHNPGLNM